ncbi:hypothetical protein [Streptomyces sp. NPDC056405]
MRCHGLIPTPHPQGANVTATPAPTALLRMIHAQADALDLVAD